MKSTKKFLRTVIVAMSTKGLSPSLTHLRPMFKNHTDPNTTIVIHRDPIMMTDENGVHTNFDILITTAVGDLDLDSVVYSGINSVVRLPREPKDIQII